MNCDNCPLNIDLPCFKGELFHIIPVYVRELFVCRNKNSCKKSLCSKDLWVLSFIGTKEKLAVEYAIETLNKLVAKGHSELIIHLFENADYETRRKLWLHMTKDHSDRLYLFNSFFERQELAPLLPDSENKNLHIYQHHMLFNTDSANRVNNITN